MWQRIKNYFRDSETLALAWFTRALGVIAGAITYVDPSLIEPLLTPWGFSLFLLVYGIALEYLRRRRADDL